MYRVGYIFMYLAYLFIFFRKFFYGLKLCQKLTTMETAETRGITATTFRWLWICHRISPKFLAQQCQ